MATFGRPAQGAHGRDSFLGSPRGFSRRASDSCGLPAIGGWGGSGYFWHAWERGPACWTLVRRGYGFGYGGFGYQGGYWNGSHFYYKSRRQQCGKCHQHSQHPQPHGDQQQLLAESRQLQRRPERRQLPSPPRQLPMISTSCATWNASRQQEHFASNNRAQFAAVESWPAGNGGHPACPGEFPSRGATASNNFNRGSNFVRPTPATPREARTAPCRLAPRNVKMPSRVRRTIPTRMQQNNARSPNARSSNSRPSDSRQFNSRSSNARSSNSARQPSSPAFRQNTSRPATRSNPAPQQSRSARHRLQPIARQQRTARQRLACTQVERGGSRRQRRQTQRPLAAKHWEPAARRTTPANKKGATIAKSRRLSLRSAGVPPALLLLLLFSLAQSPSSQPNVPARRR